MRMIRTNILNPFNQEQTQLLVDWIVTIEGTKFTGLQPFLDYKDFEGEDKRDHILIPGLIDIHVHLSQYRIRGLYRPALLPWLNECVFPEEQLSRSSSYAKSVAEDFFSALLRAGTTSSVVYTAPYKEACEEAFEAARRLGVRAWIGMTLMDRNSPEAMQQSTEYAIENSVTLYEKYNGVSDILHYIFTPRFAPTCSAELMKEIATFAIPRKAWIQTHLSENKDEIAWVKSLFGFSSYTELYSQMGLLSANTIMAHCIHLSESELRLLSDSQTKIAHCPDSNFYLKSGEFDLPEVLKHGIDFALGSDVGAGTSLSMFYHAKMMNYRQSILPVTPELAFYSITLGAAKLMQMEDHIGSIAIGKEADYCLIKLSEDLNPDQNLLSKMVFYGDQLQITETSVAGRKVYHR